ncbi:DNA-binding protein [Streptomyces sp. NPDC057638]|uniref:DNA-binding protein n=1 Tax=Streptomyces sp. NPDC057638 TaxID=3346190 RepID=UPI003693933F
MQPKTLLKVLVDQRQWRYRAFADAFSAAARRVIKGGSLPTVTERQFRRWTGGQLQTLPEPDACLVLKQLFGIDAVQLFAPPPDAALATPEGPPALVFDLEAEITMTAREAQEGANAIAAASLSDTTLDQIRDEVTVLARRYHELPVIDVWNQGRSLLRNAEEKRERTMIPVQQQELLILSGQAAGLLAVASFNLGALAGARSFARTSALYGESARFNPLRAYADGTLAYIAYFSAEPSRAVDLARRALSYDGLGDTARSRLHAIEGRAHGHLGDTESARSSMRAAEEASGKRDDLHDGVGGEFGFAPERLAMSNSATALLINDAPQAESAARRALALVSERPPAQQSAAIKGSAAADLAFARLLADDIDGVAQALTTVWDVPPGLRALGLLTRAAHLRHSLARPRYQTTTRDLTGRLEDFISSATVRQIGGGAPDALALER